MIGLMRMATLLSLGLALAAGPAHSGEMPRLKDQADPIEWRTDYAEAREAASVQRKMLFVYFRAAELDELSSRFENESLADTRVARELQNMITVRLPLDVKSKADDGKAQLVDHPAFAELEGKQGVALIDMMHKGEDYYGHVVSALPLTTGKYYQYRPDHLAVMLDLPAGTITQRTLMFAVRIHPEAPASTKGELSPVLVDEAKTHSHYQAQIRVQGHHHWDRRFQRLANLLPRGLRAREVCAESWPNEKLVDAAVDCVGCWRQSSGHWSAVRAQHPQYGYDMKKGDNGIWYATGVFGSGD